MLIFILYVEGASIRKVLERRQCWTSCMDRGGLLGPGIVLLLIPVPFRCNEH